MHMWKNAGWLKTW